jgi:type VI secretion system Hcp family effector
MNGGKGLAAVLMAVGLIGAGNAWGAYEAYLKIDGIPGASTDAQHTGEINVLSFSWGVGRPASAARGARAASTSLSEFTIVKHVDVATPKLMMYCASGQHIPEATVATKLMTYEMRDVIISSCKDQGANETVVLKYARILMRQNPAGGTQPHPPLGSLAPNKALVARHP